MQSTTLPSVRPSLLRFLALPLACFLLILLGLNFFQYVRVRSDIASTLLSRINEKELADLQTFFNGLDDKLNIVRDWGGNGLLNGDDVISLNKKFFPLLDRKENYSGLLLADDTGREYFLRRTADTWSTRLTLPGAKGNSFIYQQWTDPQTSVDKRIEPTDYTPVERLWFHRSTRKGEVYWTPIYTFFESGEKGITASVSWDDPKRKGGYYVFGIDITTRMILSLLHSPDHDSRAIRFLVNPAGNVIIPGILPESEGTDLNYEQLLDRLVEQWKVSEQPDSETIRISWQGKFWLGSLRPLVQNNAVFWIGLVLPEKELLAEIRSTLFSVDLADILVATAGGLILLLIIWKNGGLHLRRERVDPVVRLHELINRGEGARIEFKSTVRTNLKSGKRGKEIEFAWLKSVVAFLNSRGGTLLIGVDDSGRICGLEADEFENDDRCLLHMKNLINQHIGAEFSGFINIRLVDSEDKQVVMIEVRRAGQPVFMKVGKNEEFYIRSGPSSIKLSPSQMISYVLQNRLKTGR